MDVVGWLILCVFFIYSLVFLLHIVSFFFVSLCAVAVVSSFFSCIINGPDGWGGFALCAMLGTALGSSYPNGIACKSAAVPRWRLVDEENGYYYCAGQSRRNSVKLDDDGTDDEARCPETIQPQHQAATTAVQLKEICIEMGSSSTNSRCVHWWGNLRCASVNAHE